MYIHVYTCTYMYYILNIFYFEVLLEARSISMYPTSIYTIFICNSMTLLHERLSSVLLYP